MERNLITRGVVLASAPKGDADRQFRLLSEDLGIVPVTSYGARKSNKIVKAGLCTEGRFYLYCNPVRGTYTLTDIADETMHERILEDLDRSWCAMFFCEVLLRTSGGDQKEALDLMHAALAALEDEGLDKNQIVISFLWHLIGMLGLQPSLDACPVCGRRYGPDEILGFSAALTAPCCRSCATVGMDLMLPPGARRYLAYTAGMSFGQAVRVELSPGARSRIKAYLLRYISLIIGGRGLKTLEGGILQMMG